MKLELPPCSADERTKVIIAACFHDIGIWSDATLDYLAPSSRLAGDYLRRSDRAAWQEEVESMVLSHHKLRRFHDARFPLVEAFRKADLVDVSLGMVRMGLSRQDIARTKEAFPNRGFHKRLVQLGSHWLPRHPLRPLPFLRW